MKLVQRGNKQLRVADDRLEDMLKAGYIELDEKTGKPVKSPAAKTEADALRKENAALKKENKELTAQVEQLAAQVEALTAKAEG